MTTTTLEQVVADFAAKSGPVTREEIRRVLLRIIEASQGNFDHLSGEAGVNVNVFNKFVKELEDSQNDQNDKLADLESRVEALE